MATKILLYIKVNKYRVFFGQVNRKFILSLPDIGVSGYFDEFVPLFQQQNVMKLSDLFKRGGFRNIALSWLIINEVTKEWSDYEERNHSFKSDRDIISDWNND